MKINSLKDSITVRMAVVAVLGVLLLIPISLVGGLIRDREHTRASAVREITEKWGRQQTLVGPVLSVPIQHTINTNDGATKTSIEYAHFLPDSLAIDAQVFPEIRYRGIYRVVLYNARLSISADFPSSLRYDIDGTDGTILWKEAFITFGMSDLKGIRSLSNGNFAGEPVTPEPGLRTKDLVKAGFTFRTPLSPSTKPLHLTLDANINGSEEFRVVPLAKQSTISAHASWGAPSFIGDFLPESREITANSFDAAWNVLHLNRNLPQAWKGTQSCLQESTLGVKLLLPVDEYQKNLRAVKYAIMFIAMTFFAFTIIDALCASPFHPIQYTLVGLALILFFVLLLSMSEYLSFNISYLLASISINLVICMYTRGVTRGWEITITIASILTVLYAFLFVLLQVEDYALMLGSMGLLVSLTLVMYLTRGIDWFGTGVPKDRESEPICRTEPCPE